jgi:hypothetical protein
MTNRAYDWVAEEEHERLLAARRAWRQKHDLAIRIATWIAIFGLGVATGWFLH